MHLYAQRVLATATCLGGWLAGWLAGWVVVCHSRYCIKTTKPILKLFRLSGSPIIQAFRTPYADTKFQGKPHHRGLYIHGVGKIGNIRRKWPISRKWCEIGRWWLWNVNGKSWVPDLVLYLIFTFLAIFENSRWRTAAILKIEII